MTYYLMANFLFHISALLIDPTAVQNLTLTAERQMDESVGRNRWNYTATWNPPNPVHCDNLSSSEPYVVQIFNDSALQLDENYFSFWVDSEESVVFSVWPIWELGEGKSQTLTLLDVSDLLGMCGVKPAYLYKSLYIFNVL